MKFILAILLFLLPITGIAQTNQMFVESHLIKFKNAKMLGSTIKFSPASLILEIYRVYIK